MSPVPRCGLPACDVPGQSHIVEHSRGSVGLQEGGEWSGAIGQSWVLCSRPKTYSSYRPWTEVPEKSARNFFLVSPYLLSRSSGKEESRHWRIPSSARLYQASSDLSLERAGKRKYFPFQRSVDKQRCFRWRRKAADRVSALNPSSQKHALALLSHSWNTVFLLCSPCPAQRLSSGSGRGDTPAATPTGSGRFKKASDASQNGTLSLPGAR